LISQIYPLVSLIQSCSSLRHLDVSHGTIGDESAATFQQFCAVARMQLTELSLEFNELADAHEAGLVALCAADSRVTSLDLRGNPKVPIPSFVAMLSALHTNTSLAVLKATAAEGAHYPLVDATVQLLDRNSTVSDIDFGLPIEILDNDIERVARIKDKLLQNALYAASKE